MWLIYALAAACIWGIDYVLCDRIFKYKISPVSLLTAQLLFGLLIFSVISYRTQLKHDMLIILSNPSLLWLMVFATITFNLGNLLIFLSIQAKNATIAALIELSYPIFTVLFAWLLFSENNLSTSVLIGGSLIFLGIIIIAYFN